MSIPTELLMMSIFIIFMGYFSKPWRAKMYFLSLIGLEMGIIVRAITNINSEVQRVSTSINEPVWTWVIVLVYFGGLFMLGRYLSSMDNKE